MNIKIGLKGVVLALILCCTMSVTSFASEGTLSATLEKSNRQAAETQISEKVTVIPAKIAENESISNAKEELDANRVIYRKDSLSGRFYGNYLYQFTNTDKVYLDVYMPNYSGADWLQGTVSLVGNDGSIASVNIANYAGDSWTITFTGIKQGIQYRFYYDLYSVGTSGVGYIASAARVE